MDALVQTIEGSAINSWILSSYWLWPVLEIIHFIGLSLLLGAMLIVDLRLAGYLRQIDIMATHRLFSAEDDPGANCGIERVVVHLET